LSHEHDDLVEIVVEEMNGGSSRIAVSTSGVRFSTTTLRES